MIERISAEACRRLLLAAQGLLDDPRREATPDSLYDLIEGMGFVQLDSINVLERAHHLTLASRLDGYRPTLLTRIFQDERRLFEHWTHDASLLPVKWYPYWRVRFERRARAIEKDAWWRERVGDNPQPVIAHVLERIAREGPLRSQDFEHERGASGGWWSWKPQKAALEYLWASGRLAVRNRRAFQKVYDLPERVFPEAVALPSATEAAYRDWCCEAALERLGVATAAEIAGFWHGVTLAEARAWCERALRKRRIRAVLAEDVAGDARPGFAVRDWEKRLEAAPAAPKRMRLLCPFDPIVRDRKRLERLFGFNYRFEAFVPAPRRQYGYYVLPLLEGERLVGRLDAKTHRKDGVLEVRGVWWEPRARPTAKRLGGLDEALGRLADYLGVERVMMP